MLTALLLSAALSTSAPAAAGHWQGYLQRGSARLQVSFDLPADVTAHALFSSYDLGAIDVPLANVREDKAAHWELVGDSSTLRFDGTVQGDELDGTFTETSKPSGTFTLHRASLSTDKPYTEEEVTFRYLTVPIAGTVFAPRDKGPHPAVIFVQGSGPEGRWASKYLADYVARHGMVALVYDKRGVGASGGDWKTSELGELADDARAGVDLLAHRSDVDPKRIGVYGHSQGGEIAPAIAQGDPQVAWIIAADGPVGPQFMQDMFRVDNILTQHFSGQQLDDAEKLYAEFVDVARHGSPHDRLRADIKRAGAAPWLDYLSIPDDGDWVWAFYKKIGDYDSSFAWSRVKVPVLLLFGGDDQLVPVQDSIEHTTRLLKFGRNPDVTVKVFPGADHTLRVPPATADGWPQNAAGFPDIIVTFADSALKK
jgi:dienelactone hydrolase